jgi:hypothetical protein
MPNKMRDIHRLQKKNTTRNPYWPERTWFLLDCICFTCLPKPPAQCNKRLFSFIKRNFSSNITKQKSRRKNNTHTHSTKKERKIKEWTKKKWVYLFFTELNFKTNKPVQSCRKQQPCWPWNTLQVQKEKQMCTKLLQTIKSNVYDIYMTC